MKFYTGIFAKIISLGNLFLAWDEFKIGKLKKIDVLEFEWNLEQNILKLYRDLKYHRYIHDVYTSFSICDPKYRRIHKATVRDRILHHAIFRVLNPIFEPSFISHSFSCRIDKGTHRGVNSLTRMLNTVSKNNRKRCYVLKCDIRKFFDSVDQEILLNIIKKRIRDKDSIWLLENIIRSFPVQSQIESPSTSSGFFERERESKISAGNFTQYSLWNDNKNKVGIPIGNLTSQLFANIYLNEFDYFIKHILRIEYYVRYTDDFVIIADNKYYLVDLIPKIKEFLSEKLKLEIHPNKILIKKYHQGIDFLGYIIFPKYRLLRTKTKRRIYTKLRQRVNEYETGIIDENSLKQSLNSYLGVLSHADSYEAQQDLLNQFWFWMKE